MKRTLATAPVLALAALSCGLWVQPAAAADLPLPLPSSLTDTVAGLLPLPTASPLPLPLPLPTASALPLPLPTTSALPLPLPGTSALPLPLPTALPTALSTALPSSAGTLGKAAGTAPVRAASASRSVVQPGADALTSSALTGSAPGLQLSSASMPAWASALLGDSSFPSVAKAGRAPATAVLTATRSGGSAPTRSSDLPVAVAVAALAVAAGSNVLARRRRTTV